METKQLLSVGMNSKLGKKIGIFNLPSGVTCPGATPFCAKKCYARKAERCYKTAREKRAWNLERTREPGFAKALSEEIRTRRLTQVRVHESGDYYSQEYLAAVMEVARENPEVTFLSYTKSFHLNWENKPKNLVVYASVDKTTPEETLARVKELGFPVAETVDKGELPKFGKDTCVWISEKHYCGSECFVCWAGKEPVFFDLH